MITLGVDPGLSGAFVLYNTLYVPPTAPGEGPGRNGPLMLAWDMPTVQKEVSGKPRKIIDLGGLHQLVETLIDVFDLDRVVIEEVGGMPGQSGSAAFNFGFGVGQLHMAFHACGKTFETVRPGQWKKAVKAPADKKLAVARADELFPEHRHLWRNPPAKGQKNEQLHPDRAEAALLAYWAAQPGGA